MRTLTCKVRTHFTLYIYIYIYIYSHFFSNVPTFYTLKTVHYTFYLKMHIYTDPPNAYYTDPPNVYMNVCTDDQRLKTASTNA